MTSAKPKSVSTAFDTKSYASSRVDIELEYLAKEVDLERDRRRKLQDRASNLAKLLEEKATLEDIEKKQLTKSRRSMEKKYALRFQHQWRPM